MAIALLKYTFQFDPAEAWTSLSQFEEYLNKSLDAIGLSSNITAPLGAPSSERYIIITKKEVIMPQEPPKLEVKDNLKNLRSPKSYTTPKAYK